MIDVKGDLPNLLLSFPTFDPAAFRPWAEGVMGPHDERPFDAVAKALAEERQKQLGSWGIAEADLRRLAAGTETRVLTPGSNAGEPIHLLSSLERRSPGPRVAQARREDDAIAKRDFAGFRRWASGAWQSHKLAPRWFLVRNVRAKEEPLRLMQPR